MIDGEERERDRAEFRAGIADLKDAFAGTRVAARIPIGVKEVRAAFTADSVRAFSKRWYRPENMTLVIVGDLGELDPAPLVTRAVRRPARARVGRRSTSRRWACRRARNDVFVHFYNAELPVVTLTVAQWKPWEDEPHTKAEMVEDLPLRVRAPHGQPALPRAGQEAGRALPAARAGRGRRPARRRGRGACRSRPSPRSGRRRWRWASRSCAARCSTASAAPELDEVRKDALRALDEAVEREAHAHELELRAGDPGRRRVARRAHDRRDRPRDPEAGHRGAHARGLPRRAAQGLGRGPAAALRRGRPRPRRRRRQGAGRGLGRERQGGGRGAARAVRPGLRLLQQRRGRAGEDSAPRCRAGPRRHAGALREWREAQPQAHRLPRAAGAGVGARRRRPALAAPRARHGGLHDRRRLHAGRPRQAQPGRRAPPARGPRGRRRASR